MLSQNPASIADGATTDDGSQNTFNLSLSDDESYFPTGFSSGLLRDTLIAAHPA